MAKIVGKIDPTTLARRIGRRAAEAADLRDLTYADEQRDCRELREQERLNRRQQRALKEIGQAAVYGALLETIDTKTMTKETTNQNGQTVVRVHLPDFTEARVQGLSASDNRTLRQDAIRSGIIVVAGSSKVKITGLGRRILRKVHTND